MKIVRGFIRASVLVFLVSVITIAAYAESEEDLLTRLGGETQLVNGLKEALKVGASSAVELVSQLDGFYKNDLIKVLLPEKLQHAEEVLKKAGFGKLIDDFELSMNRAAEKAASSAASLLVNAITDMTIEDAVKIFKGEDDAATLYFQEKMTEPLTSTFKPIVETAMTEVGVTHLYQELESHVKAMIPLGIGDMFNIDLSQYVTDRTLDGLFLMLAKEEKKIRENPEARVTDLLESIFK